MVPASGAKAPTRIFIRVLLPEPFSPTRPTTSPGYRARSNAAQDRALAAQRPWTALVGLFDPGCAQHRAGRGTLPGCGDGFGGRPRRRHRAPSCVPIRNVTDKVIPPRGIPTGSNGLFREGLPGSSTPRNGGPAGGTPGMLTWRPQARSGVKPQPPGDFAQAVVVRSAVTTCQMGPASPGPGTRNARAGPGAAALARSPACAGARSERAAAAGTQKDGQTVTANPAGSDLRPADAARSRPNHLHHRLGPAAQRPRQRP